MGKHPNSTIHAAYSDWHWQLRQIDKKYKRLYTADIDRLWIEYDFKRDAIVAVIDIKWLASQDGLTATEKGIYNWFEKRGARTYTVYINKDFTLFKTINSRGVIREYSDIEYADWLLSLRTAKYKFNSGAIK